MKTIAIAIAVVLILVLSYAFIASNSEKRFNEVAAECDLDVDCQPATCCHPSSCVTYDKVPNCTGTFCTAVCEKGTMDCGQGRCACVESKCTAVIY
jgi:hypothetical protein